MYEAHTYLLIPFSLSLLPLPLTPLCLSRSTPSLSWHYSTFLLLSPPFINSRVNKISWFQSMPTRSSTLPSFRDVLSFLQPQLVRHGQRRSLWSVVSQLVLNISSHTCRAIQPSLWSLWMVCLIFKDHLIQLHVVGLRRSTEDSGCGHFGGGFSFYCYAL